MDKKIAKRKEICLTCSNEIPPGNTFYEHYKDKMDISCYDCYKDAFLYVAEDL